MGLGRAAKHKDKKPEGQNLDEKGGEVQGASSGSVGAKNGAPRLGVRKSKSEAARAQAREKMKAQLLAGEKNAVDQAVDDAFEYRTMFLNELTPNPKNSRTRHINPIDPLKNMLEEDHPDFKENCQVIEDIRTMSEHLKKEPLQSPIEIYRDGTRHMVNAGHVRYFASFVAYGAHGKIETKCYYSAPKTTAARRFRENNARHDLALKAKALDFRMARDGLVEERGEMTAVELGVSLGISRTTVRIYSIAVDDEHVWRALDEGGISKLRTLQLIYNKGPLKDADRMAAMADYLLSDPANESTLEQWFVKGAEENKKPSSKGRPRKKAKIESNSLPALKHLVQGDFMKEFEWTDADFESFEAFQEKLDACMKAFASQHK